MSIDTYASDFQSLLCELKESLSQEEINELRSDISKMPESGWDSFFHKNQEEINEFLVSSRSKRAKLKKFQDPCLKKRLTLAAVQRLKAASIFLEKMHVDNFVGLPHREAFSLAADQYFELFFSYPGYHWPFDMNPPEGFWVDQDKIYG